MKKIKIVILGLLIVILTGCKGEYNLIVNKDLSLSEDVSISIDNNEGVYEKTLKLFEDNNVDDSMYNVSQDEETVNIRYKEDFKNFEDYFLNSKFYSRILSDEDYTKDNKKIGYRGFAYLKLDDVDNSDLNNSFNISNIKINLSVPFAIKDNNADKVDGNTLTWNLNQNDTNKIISFSFEYLKTNNLYFLIILLCVGIVSVTSFILIRNYLKERGI